MHIHFRYMKKRQPKPGFYNPPPPVERYGGGTTIKNGGSSQGSRVGTLRSEYSGVSTNPALSMPLQQRPLGTSMSMQSQQSVTATSTML